MSKRLVAVILALLVVSLVGSVVGCGGGLPKDAVAKVGGAYITQADFDLRVSQTAAQYGITKEDSPDYYKEIEAQVIGTMVETALATIKAQELGLTVTEEEVQAEIDEMLGTWYSDDLSLLEADLATANLTMDQFRAEYREYLLTEKVYEEMTKDVPAPSDEDIATSYETSKDSYFTAASRTVRHILVTPGEAVSDDSSTTSTTAAAATTTTSLTDADWAEALAEANEAREKLVAGGDWTEVAAEYSDDPYSKDKGGELGAVGKGEMVQEFEDAVFAQDVDEISQPIKTIYGYHVIQVTAITEAVQQTLEEVKESISTTLLDEAKYTKWLSWVEEMKTNVKISYREDLAPVTTTTAAPGGADTTVAPGESTTTTAGQTITTLAPATATTAKP